jgi:hypothetical protein
MTDVREREVATELVGNGPRVNPKKAPKGKVVFTQEDIVTALDHATNTPVKEARKDAKANKHFWAGRIEAGSRMNALGEDAKPWLVRQTNALINTTAGRAAVIVVGVAVVSWCCYGAYGEYQSRKGL